MNHFCTSLFLVAYQNGGAPSLDAKPVPAGVTAVQTGTAQAPGATPGAADPAAGGGNAMLLVMLAVFGAMILFTAFGSRRERKKRQQMLGAIKKHDRVVTAGGIIGSVVELKDETVVLKVDEDTNTRITVTKTAINHVLTDAKTA